MLPYLNLNFYCTRKNMKKLLKEINLKYLLPHGIINLNCQMDYILLLIFKIFEYIIEKHGIVTDNPPVRIYVNNIEKRIPFKIKTGYYLDLELLMPEIMNLLRSTKNKTTKDKNDKNVPPEIILKPQAASGKFGKVDFFTTKKVKGVPKI